MDEGKSHKAPHLAEELLQLMATEEEVSVIFSDVTPKMLSTLNSLRLIPKQVTLIGLIGVNKMSIFCYWEGKEEGSQERNRKGRDKRRFHFFKKVICYAYIIN